MTPPFYKTAQELEDKIEEYFCFCDEGEMVQIARKGGAIEVKKSIPYTVPDLAVFLGYATRGALWDLKQVPVYSDTVRWALSRIEGQRVRKALNGEQDSRFAQFDLKNNFGYKDTQEVVNLNVNVTLTDKEIDLRLARLDKKARRVEGIKEVAVIEHDSRRKLLI